MSLLEKVIDIVATTLKVNKDEISKDSGLGTIAKWDSLNHTNLVLELEDAFDIGFDFDELDKIITVEKIVASLEDKGVTI
ncbi:acyl carrier protein [Marinospirillum insulare]|uniref:Carrier domain-containing protein n=1 Tax=Marinospirillum insulare TaxID=217169 RepID=A0ABQ6A390_9GAMM|nr:acyl carrier protein [Marinospirillum insulare]GLR64653.1 hypothetical protein GCM10007878_20910 [Marinospirillum insulare]